MFIVYVLGFLLFGLAFMLALAFPPGIRNGLTVDGFLYLLILLTLTIFCFYKAFGYRFTSAKVKAKSKKR